MKHLRYFLKRFLLIPPTLIGITIICFILAQFVPGGPVEQMMLKLRNLSQGETKISNNKISSSNITEKQRKEIEKYFGFDKPIYIRYFIWLNKAIHLDLGDSYKYPNKTVWNLIKEKFRISLIFGLTGFILQYIICIPLGIIKAVKNGSKFDFISSAIIFAGYAIPAFAFGMILKMLFCGTNPNFWDIFPIAGFISDNFDSLSFGYQIIDIIKHMFLPVLCYVIGSFAILTILMKNSLLEQINTDYVKAVIAKGASLKYAILHHSLRNSLIPIATGIGGFLTLIFAGSVLIEQVFSIPGMGALSLEAIVGRDYNVFMGLILLQSVLALIGNIISDFCYILIDPGINFN